MQIILIFLIQKDDECKGLLDLITLQHQDITQRGKKAFSELWWVD